MRKLLYIVVLVLGSRCTKNIELKLPEYKEHLVVQGSIETDAYPIVYLSYSIPYFGANNVNNLSDFAVKGAFITVSDGVLTDTLKELNPGFGYAYVGNKITGQTGKTYQLYINVNGNIFTSQTSIHPPVSLDSLWNKHEQNDSLGFVWARLSDPAGLGNCYRWYAKRIGKDFDFIAPTASSFEDKFIDGQTLDFAFARGVIQNSQATDDNNIERGYFKTGDVVVVKFSTIGKPEYEFLRSFDINMLSNGNPFASPSNVKSNVTGNQVIGLWCGYSPSLDTLIFN